MLRTSIFALTALAFVCTASTPFAAPANGYVPKRTVLQQTDVPGSNMTVILVETDLEPNSFAARHTHPGVEISYVLAGECDFIIEGKGTMHVKAGGSFRLESGVKHSVKVGPTLTKILAVYTIPKGAEMATPAPE
jgi:quercetin dioxygenase-like cupin family protein